MPAGRLLFAISVLVIAAGCRAKAPDYPAAPPAAHSMPDRDPGRPWTTRSLFTTLRFQNPVFAWQPPRDPGLWYVGEREGRILAVPHRPDASAAETVLDLRRQTLGWQDCGLLNLAFHPEFGKAGSPNRGYIYVWYNYTDDPHPGPASPVQDHRSANRLSRFTVPDGKHAADPASEFVLIEQQRTNLDHHGGGLFFHPGDGFLYLTVGDGGHEVTRSRDSYFIGSTDEPQRLDGGLLSGVLRIDIEKRGGAVSHPIRRQPHDGHTQGYFIPNDNPWVDPAGGRLEEFFAIGLRNPHRMTHDPVTGHIFIGDVGEGAVEEIDLLAPGANYQWSFREGLLPGRRPRPAQVIGEERGPLWAYPHRGFNSVIGGFVYRGQAHPELVGQYLFGDTGTGEIWAFDAAAATGKVSPRLLLRLPQERTAYAGLASFAVDAAGEMYLVVLGQNQKGNGTLEALVRRPDPVRPAPPTLTATGLFRNTAALAPAKALFPYEINTPFWSDHAVKTRWLHVPQGQTVKYNPQGQWTFPAGTVAVKHFDLALDPAHPQHRRRLETRVLVKDAEGEAYGRVYKWRDDGQEADLLDGPLTERLTIPAGEPLGALEAEPAGGQGPGRLEARPGGGWTLTSPRRGTLFARVPGADGDFDLAADLARLAGGNAGWLVRSAEGEGTASDTFFVGREASGGVLVERRRAGVAAAQVRAPAPPEAGTWIRLRRSGDRLFAFIGRDGQRWQELGEGQRFFAPRGATSLGLVLSAVGEVVAQAEVSAALRCETRDHYYPSKEECRTCHTASAQHFLGVSTRQWNRDVVVPGAAPVNQLVLASQRGLLDRPVSAGETAGLERLVAPGERGASLEHRVRSYLDANCSQCHRDGNVVGVALDARFETPLDKQGMLWARGRWPAMPHPEDFVVAPRDLDRSRLYQRVRQHEMPPLGGVLTDTGAVDLLREWIMQLDGPPVLAQVSIRYQPQDKSTRVELSHPDPAVAIHYTTDGSAPAEDTPLYRAPFTVTAPATVRAIAYRPGHTRSRLVSAAVPRP